MVIGPTLPWNEVTSLLTGEDKYGELESHHH